MLSDPQHPPVLGSGFPATAAPTPSCEINRLSPRCHRPRVRPGDQGDYQRRQDDRQQDPRVAGQAVRERVC
jgi:hypothetical protein